MGRLGPRIAAVVVLCLFVCRFAPAVAGTVAQEAIAYQAAVTGYDPDAEDTVSCRKTAGPPGLQVTARPDNSGCDISWDSPALGDYTVAGEITSDAPDAKSVPFTYALHVNARPRLDTPTLGQATENQPYEATVRCSDPDGPAPTPALAGLPAWLHATDNGDGSLTLGGTPGYDYVNHATHGSQRAATLTVTCSDDAGGSVQAALSLATNDTDRPIVRLP